MNDRKTGSQKNLLGHGIVVQMVFNDFPEQLCIAGT